MYCVFVVLFFLLFFFFFFKQKTAYEMRISDWSSDVCSSDLGGHLPPRYSDEAGLGMGRIDRPRRAFIGGVFDDRGLGARDLLQTGKIGRASCRERVCQYV